MTAPAPRVRPPTPVTPYGDLVVRGLTGPELLADVRPWVAAYEEVYAADANLPDHADPPIADRLTRHALRPGFRLYAALDGDQVAGYCYAYTLPGDTLWWDGFVPDPAAPPLRAGRAEFVREWPGRTAAVCEVLVRGAWRRTGIAKTLHDTFVADRDEERAAGFVAASNSVLLATYQGFGWVRAGEQVPYPGWRPHVAIVRELP